MVISLSLNSAIGRATLPPPLPHWCTWGRKVRSNRRGSLSVGSLFCLSSVSSMEVDVENTTYLWHNDFVDMVCVWLLFVACCWSRGRKIKGSPYEKEKKNTKKIRGKKNWKYEGFSIYCWIFLSSIIFSLFRNFCKRRPGGMLGRWKDSLIAPPLTVKLIAPNWSSYIRIPPHHLIILRLKIDSKENNQKKKDWQQE